MECVSESGVASIGDSYRRTHPDWTADSVTEIGAGTSLSFRKRRQSLLDKIRADFAGGKLVQVQGWILARSEAEQCARFSAKPFS